MANMTYCRYENTVSDLRDCFEALQEEIGDPADNIEGMPLEDLSSPQETQARLKLVALCIEIADAYSDEYGESVLPLPQFDH